MALRPSKGGSEMKKNMHRSLFLAGLSLTLLSYPWGAESPTPTPPPASLQITPEIFDFGWSPDNSKINAQFSIKNVGSELIPLTAVQPSCGCTATDFTPADLASSELTKVMLTFNTKGYTGLAFNKMVTVKAGKAESEYIVRLEGVVADPKALVIPVGNGVVEFTKGDPENAKTVELVNKSSFPITLHIIQEASDWARVNILDPSINPSSQGKIEVQVKGSFEEERFTSCTLEAVGEQVSRLTLAIRTGPPPEPYRRVRPPVDVPKSKSSPLPSATPPAPK